MIVEDYLTLKLALERKMALFGGFGLSLRNNKGKLHCAALQGKSDDFS